jgi:hypothetical protein
VIAALMSFRMVALLPHHLPRLVGFTAANRVDMEDFFQRAAWAPSEVLASSTTRAIKEGASQFGQGPRSLPRGATRYISGPTKASDDAAREAESMDSTLRATTEISPRNED